MNTEKLDKTIEAIEDGIIKEVNQGVFVKESRIIALARLIEASATYKLASSELAKRCM